MKTQSNSWRPHQHQETDNNARVSVNKGVYMFINASIMNLQEPPWRHFTKNSKFDGYESSTIDFSSSCSCPILLNKSFDMRVKRKWKPADHRGCIPPAYTILTTICPLFQLLLLLVVNCELPQICLGWRLGRTLIDPMKLVLLCCGDTSPPLLAQIIKRFWEQTLTDVSGSVSLILCNSLLILFVYSLYHWMSMFTIESGSSYCCRIGHNDHRMDIVNFCSIFFC